MQKREAVCELFSFHALIPVEHNAGWRLAKPIFLDENIVYLFFLHQGSASLCHRLLRLLLEKNQ